MQEITSVQNPKIKQIIKLRKKRERDISSLFLIEGYKELLLAFENHIEIQGLYYCPEFFLQDNERTLIENIGKEKSFLCRKNVFAKISYRDRPDGLLAVARQKSYDKVFLEKLIKNLSHPPFLLVAESIEKPGNLGTILRSCDGVKVDAVIVCDSCTDIFNPNVVRASIGTLFTQPVIEMTTSELIKFLQKNAIQIIAATPHANKFYFAIDLCRPVAIVVGTEQYGLSKLWMQNCNEQVKIPMKGIADSLNVASATTILLYEVLRQRDR